MSTEIISGQSARIRTNELREGTFRANPDYEFALLDQLSAEEQQPLSALRGDANFYGLIRPRLATGLTTKAASREIAELFRILQEPGPLPQFILSELDSELTIRRLVLDGILQLAQGSESICGPAVCDEDALTPTEEGARLLARLSLQAINHAASIVSAGATELSDRLYRYNTVPLTPQWLRRIPDGPALEQYLQIQVGGRCRRILDKDWTRVSPQSKRKAEQKAEPNPWLSWDSRTVPAQKPDSVGYKLYLSPLATHLREAFRVSIPAITAAGAHHFKIGSNVRGVLRPDKMVAYFPDRSALEEAAHRIAKELSGCPAQGVPFTTELDAGALLSWASDPPMEADVPAWLQKQSWRQWICYRLGSALAVAKREKSPAMPAWRFALERVRLEGVDVSTWIPTSTSWQSEPAAVVVSRLGHI